MQKPSLIDYLKSYPLYLLPKHILSALLHRFMRIKHPGIKNEISCWYTENLYHYEKLIL